MEKTVPEVVPPSTPEVLPEITEVEHPRPNHVKTTLIVLVILLGLVSLGYYFKNNLQKDFPVISQLPQPSVAPSPTPATISKASTKPCDGTYTDADFHFSIPCPANSTAYVTVDEENPYMHQHQKMIFLCDAPLKPDETQGYYRCTGGGMLIWINADGLGGGCDARDYQKLKFNGEDVEYCMSSTGFGQLYTTHGSDRYYLTGSFSKTFTKENALKALSALKFN